MQIVLRRVLIAIPTLLLLSLVVFLLLELAPGDVTFAVLDPSSDQGDAVREELGLNRPVLLRYVDYVANLLRGDMGNTVRSGQPVVREIGIRLPYTLALIAASILLGTLAGATMGIIAAHQQGKLADTVITGLISAAMATPTFWLALVLVNVFALQLRILPVFGADSLKHLILPAVCTSLTLVPGIARLTRASLLEARGADFILFAQSKGLSGLRILLRHITPVAAISVVTYIGLQTVRLISIVTIMEIIFSWPGLGGLAISAAFDRDPFLVQGTTLTIAALTFAILFLVDVIVAYLDPRIARKAV